MKPETQEWVEKAEGDLIASRYPGVRADRRAAEEAVTTAEEVRTVIRAKLGLP